jgi:hypothetical protein
LRDVYTVSDFVTEPCCPYFGHFVRCLIERRKNELIGGVAGDIKDLSDTANSFCFVGINVFVIDDEGRNAVCFEPPPPLQVPPLQLTQGFGDQVPVIEQRRVVSSASDSGVSLCQQGPCDRPRVRELVSAVDVNIGNRCQRV